MKETYQKPAAQKCTLLPESMLAGSVVVNPDKETNIILSDKRGWSTTDWDATTED